MTLYPTSTILLLKSLLFGGTFLLVPSLRAELPQLVPPFLPQETARQPFEMIEGSEGKQPALASENKELQFYENASRGISPGDFDVFCNNEAIARGKIFCYFLGKDASSVAKTEGTLQFDAEKQELDFERGFNLAGNAFQFSYRIGSTEDGVVDFKWNLGVSEDQLKGWGMRGNVSLAFDFESSFVQENLTVNGVGIRLPSIAGRPEKPGAFEVFQVVSEEASIVVPALDGNVGFSLRLKPGFRATFSSKQNANGRLVRLEIQPIAFASEGVFSLDMGETSLATLKAPQPVAGVDFWKSDRTHVPTLPTRNLIPNPGFEQGLRYYTWRIRGGGQSYEADPGAPPAYEISDDAKFGKHAFRINATHGNRDMVTFALPLEPGKTYTASFYSKGEPAYMTRQPALPDSSAEKAGTAMDNYQQKARAAASEDWQRTSMTFTAHLPAERLSISSFGECLIDGIQLEEGSVATDFVSPKVEGRLTSADEDHALEFGEPLDLALELQGQPGLAGDVRLTIRNFYREIVYSDTFSYMLDEAGSERIALPINSEGIGRGIFVLEAEYSVEDQPYYQDYYRFSIIQSLDNTRPSKNIFGLNASFARLTRAERLADLFMRWGFGSTSYMTSGLVPAELLERYRIENLLNMCGPTAFNPKWLKQPYKAIFYEWESMTPEREGIVEEIAFEQASDPERIGDVWTFNTESEVHTRMWKLKEYGDVVRLYMAARRGILKARPDAIVLPDGGTSGFEERRGYDVMEKILQESQGKVVWDGLAIHPYDQHDEIDQSISHLKSLADAYQPNENTLLYVSECSSGSFVNVPEWERINQWYGEFSGKPSYDNGWKEMVHAGRSIRMYLIGLKHWPRLQNINLWNRYPYLDMNFAPVMMVGAVNHVGNLLGNPTFVADYEPVDGIKGLVFQDEQGRGVAAVWANGARVESGVAWGPSLQLKTEGLDLKFFDVMGNERTPKRNAQRVTVELAPAPLYIVGEPGEVAELVETLKRAAITGSNGVVRVKTLPDLSGRIVSDLTNHTYNSVEGYLAVGEKKLPFSLDAKASRSLVVDDHDDAAPGKLYAWDQPLMIHLDGDEGHGVGSGLSYFYVPFVESPLPADPSRPEWDTVPALPLKNFHHEENVDGGHDGDLSASFQLAWDHENLYLRVSGEDDRFLTNESLWNETVDKLANLWRYDGSVEVYFDTFADGRSSAKQDYDNNDYRYDFYAYDGTAESGEGSVYRQEEVFTELAGGPGMPSRQEVSQGGVTCEFIRDGNQYAYVMVFPQRFLLPLKLEKGSRSGFGLYLRDIDVLGQRKGLSLATEPGEACYRRPDLWPIMVFGE